MFHSLHLENEEIEKFSIEMHLTKRGNNLINFQSPGASLQDTFTVVSSACLYLVPLCSVRERFSACSFCLSASSSWASLCFSSAERAWPALTNASGVWNIQTHHIELVCRSMNERRKGLQRLTWSLNMREIISSTCMLHCCSLWADARNLTRSSKPLMWTAHNTRSCTLASSSTFCQQRDDHKLEKRGTVR